MDHYFKSTPNIPAFPQFSLEISWIKILTFSSSVFIILAVSLVNTLTSSLFCCTDLPWLIVICITGMIVQRHLTHIIYFSYNQDLGYDTLIISKQKRLCQRFLTI